MSTHIMKFGVTELTSDNEHWSQSLAYKIRTQTSSEELGRTGRNDYQSIDISDYEHYYKAFAMQVDIYEIVPSHPELPQRIASGKVSPRINYEGKLEYTLDIEHEGGRNTYRMHLNEVEAVHKLMTWAMKYNRK